MSESRSVALAGPRLPWSPQIEKEFGITSEQWRALTDAVFPSARTAEGVCLAFAYCRSRNLDVFKRPVHVVPIWDSKANNGQGGYVESVWPGIGELRITAGRTDSYAGMDECEFGNGITETFRGKVKRGKEWKTIEATVTFPEYAQVTVYKIVGGQRVAFPGPRVRWLETYGQMQPSDVPNSMWQRRPYGQLEKCAEAAALRRAFPEEIGSEYIGDEVQNMEWRGPENARDMGTVREVRDTPTEKPKRSDYQEPGNTQETSNSGEPETRRESSEPREPTQEQESDAERESDASHESDNQHDSTDQQESGESQEPSATQEAARQREPDDGWWVFAQMLDGEIKSATTTADLNAVLSEFKDDLAELETAEPSMHAGLKAAAQARRARLKETE